MAKWEAHSTLAKAVKLAGFLYDPAQDIIYSKMEALQYGLGYHWAYDCSSALLSMIIDCERFYFTYAGRHWLIELWKGQYDLETGCEIGVYCDYGSAAVNGQLNSRPGTAPAAGRVDFGAQSRFYSSVKPRDMLNMTSTLYRNGRKLFHRGPQLHWWLTGFKWGVFTRHTRELTMEVGIDFPNDEMCRAFKDAARGIGYHVREKGALGVALTFHVPRTAQPQSRIRLEGRKQEHNLALVEGYELLKHALHIPDNDPNRFTVEQAEEAARPPLSRAAAHLPHAASAAARSARREVAAAARRRTHDVPDEALTAYHEILGFFEKKVWRTTHRPGAVA